MVGKSVDRRAFLSMSAVAVAGLALTGCGGGGGAAPTQNKDAIFSLNVTNTWTCTNYDGSKVLVLDFDLTNNSDNSIPTTIVGSMYASVKQGEQALTAAYLNSEIPGVLPNGGDTVNPGQTGKGQMAFTLNSDDKVDVTVNADTKDYSKQVEVYKQTVDLSQVQNVESEASFDLSIDNAFVTDDGQGTNLVVLEMTFTNKADQPSSLSSSADLELYQNGTQLKPGYLPYNHPKADDDKQSNSYTNVQKGTSTQVQQAWALLDTTSPVEVKAIDYKSFDQRALLDKTIDIASSGATQS